MNEGLNVKRFDLLNEDDFVIIKDKQMLLHNIKNVELKEKNKEIEKLNNRLKISNDTCNYLRNTIDKAIFFIQNQELHKSKDTTGAITMKERELIDILLGSDNNE